MSASYAVVVVSLAVFHVRFARKIPGSHAAFGACVPLAAVIFTIATLGGCAHTQSAEDREMAKLRDDLSRIQIEHDQLDKRVDSLEMHTGAAASDEPDPNPPQKERAQKNSAASSDATNTPTPRLRVVHLDPDGSAPKGETDDDPNDPSTRPMLQVFGTPSRNSAGARAGSEIAQKRSAADASAFDPQAKRAYDAALALAMGKKYDEALDAFAAFLVKWPDHPNADNATYWRGECYFAKGDFAHAAEQFEGAIARFPFGNKVPDALLKLGATYDKLGDADRSKQALDRLARDYPRSDAARKISKNTAKQPEKAGAPSP